MNWKKTIYSLLPLLFVVLPASAGPADDFKAANALYNAKNFSEAISAYERIAPKTASLDFNLGNACFKAGQLGRAVLNFERARQLDPSDPDIQANLNFTEERLGVSDANVPGGYLPRFVQRVTDSCTVRQWAVYETVGVWLVLLFIAGAIWLPRWRTGCVILSVLSGLWLLGVSAALIDRLMIEKTRPAAIVLATKVDARFAPLTDATVHFQLGEGTKVAVLEDRGPWVLVERADDQQGWVKADAVERVVTP